LNAQLNTAVARILLEDEMEYSVETVPIDGGGQFPAIANGDIHASLEVWPSGRTEEIQQYTVQGDTVENGGPLGVVGKIGWFVPGYMLDEYPKLATWKASRPRNRRLVSHPRDGRQGTTPPGRPELGLLWPRHH